MDGVRVSELLRHSSVANPCGACRDHEGPASEPRFSEASPALVVRTYAMRRALKSPTVSALVFYILGASKSKKRLCITFPKLAFSGASPCIQFSVGQPISP